MSMPTNAANPSGQQALPGQTRISETMTSKILLSLPFLAASALAQDGGQPFTLYCFAYH